MSPAHRTLSATGLRTPPPFRCFAVRSEEPQHAFDARAPYGRIHVIACDFLDGVALARIAAEGYARANIEEFSDVDYAATTLQELAAAAPTLTDLGESIALALQLSGVLGPELVRYRATVATRIDYLASRGAGFHNDVRGHWSRCLFWILAVDVANIEFVMPHAGVRLPLAPADLVIFDPAMAHGLCRPNDGGQAVADAFVHGDDCCQLFLTGEIPLDDSQWAALGAPWLPIEAHAQRGALDLTVAEFDDRTGTIRRPGALRDCMTRSVCYVGAAPDASDPARPC